MFTGDTSDQYPTRASGAIRVGETIARTQRFGATVVRRRLLETLQYTLQVNHNTEGTKSGGEGHLVCVRVRLLHSTVRLKMTSLAAAKVTHEPLLVNEFGRMLARNIATGLENTAPAYASKQYMDAMTRLLNGD
ncbi:hypothetical protein VB005_10301 [Metarhizium brunneum]